MDQMETPGMASPQRAADGARSGHLRAQAERERYGTQIEHALMLLTIVVHPQEEFGRLAAAQR